MQKRKGNNVREKKREGEGRKANGEEQKPKAFFSLVEDPIVFALFSKSDKSRCEHRGFERCHHVNVSPWPKRRLAECFLSRQHSAG